MRFIPLAIIVAALVAAPASTSAKPKIKMIKCNAVVYRGIAPTAPLDLLVIADLISISGPISCYSARQKLFSDVYGWWWYEQNLPPTNDHPPSWVHPLWPRSVQLKSNWKCAGHFVDMQGVRGGWGASGSCTYRGARINWRQWDKYLNYPS